MTSRGERNLNPGNIRKSATKWAGMADEQLDPDLITFKSAQFGIRAMCRILLTYSGRGINTVQDIINTWAPPSENDSQAYIQDVAHRCQVSATDVLDIDSADIMRPLLQAIVHHECGSDPYPTSVYDDAMRLAGIADIEAKPLIKTNAAKASTVTTIGGATAAITETVRQVQSVNDTVGDAHSTITQSVGLIHTLISWGPWIAVALVVMGVCGILWAKYHDQKKLGI